MFVLSSASCVSSSGIALYFPPPSPERGKEKEEENEKKTYLTLLQRNTIATFTTRSSHVCGQLAGRRQAGVVRPRSVLLSPRCFLRAI